MKLFDEFERTDESPSGRAEPAYTFYNRSARPYFAKIREALELWFSRYPDGQDKADLRGRFVSNDNNHHNSALFELVLHETLLRLGCKVDVHPDIPNGTGKHPDFLVRHPSGDFYLEAVLVTDESKSESSAKKLLGVAYDAINKIECRDFFVDFSYEGTVKTPIKVRELKEQLQRHLRKLNYEEIKRQPYVNPFMDDRYKLTYKHDDAVLEFRPIPRLEEGRLTPPDPLIGSSSDPGGEITTHLSIKSALDDKAKKYGELDLPYVVAVNVLSTSIDFLVPDALYGERGITFQLGHPETQRYTRISEGAWRYANGTPRHTNMSAVLVFGQLVEFTIRAAPVHLHHHPMADMPYQSVLNKLTQFIAGKDGVVRAAEGLRLEDILSDEVEDAQTKYVDFKLGD